MKWTRRKSASGKAQSKERYIYMSSGRVREADVLVSLSLSSSELLSPSTSQRRTSRIRFAPTSVLLLLLILIPLLLLLGSLLK